jgi:hypothetical protein
MSKKSSGLANLSMIKEKKKDGYLFFRIGFAFVSGDSVTSLDPAPRSIVDFSSIHAC